MTSHCDPFSRECDGCRSAHSRPVAPANADVLARLVALGYEVEVYQYAPLSNDPRVLARHIASSRPGDAFKGWSEGAMVNITQHTDGRMSLMGPGVLDWWERRVLDELLRSHRDRPRWCLTWKAGGFEGGDDGTR